MREIATDIRIALAELLCQFTIRNYRHALTQPTTKALPLTC